MSILIRRTETHIYVSSPFSPDLPRRARELSGRWDRNEKEWIFPLQAENEVRALYMDVYGEFDTPADTVTIRCTVGNTQVGSPTRESLSLGGRVIARAFGRDSGARTAQGVVVVSGGFDSGGSRQNWSTDARENTIFRVLDVPRPKAQRLVENPEWCDTVEIEEPATIDREALIRERERLISRIAEIDSLLHQ